MPMVDGQCYWTSNSRLAASHENGGWLLVNDSNGRRGYIPNSLLNLNVPPNHTPSQSLKPKLPIKNPRVLSPKISKQNVNNQMSQSVSTPIVDIHNNPVVLPHSIIKDNKSNNGMQNTV